MEYKKVENLFDFEYNHFLALINAITKIFDNFKFK